MKNGKKNESKPQAGQTPQGQSPRANGAQADKRPARRQQKPARKR